MPASARMISIPADQPKGVRMDYEQITYPSGDGKTTINAYLWAPQSNARPKGIIQITHGMEEYALRYVDFAVFLSKQGYVVCIQDLLGHGKSVTSPERLSCIPMRNGKGVLIEDAHQLRMIVSSRFPEDVPYIMFGHSMGSFITRAYITYHGAGLSAAVICGSGQQPVWLSKAGNLLARLIGVLKGEDHKSPLLENLVTGSFSKAIENPRTNLDWLAVNDAVVDDYIADPLCGIPFSAGAHATLTALTAEIASPESARTTPTILPILFTAGELDPVGNMGEGVKESKELLEQNGVKHVDLKLYPGLRHEILNEVNKDEVYRDVVDWIASATKQNEESA